MAFEDYSSAGLQALQGGMQIGVGLRQARLAEDVQEQEAAKLQRQQQFVTDLQAATQSGDSKAMLDVMGAYPEQADTITKMIGAKDAQHARAIGSFAGQLSTMIDSGDIAGAMGLVAQSSDIITAQGRDPVNFAKQVQENPAAVKQAADAMMLMTMTPEEQLSYRQKLEDQAINRDRIQAQLRGQDIQVRGQNMTASTAAQRLAFDKGKFDIEMQQAAEKADQLKGQAPKLSVNMEKALDSAVGDAATSRSSAASMEELASRWETDKPTAGIFGSAQSTWNKMTGSDTGLRDLRIRTSQFLNSQALKYLPPGPATDRDVELAREGVPTNMDDPSLVANWLRAQARNEKRAALYNDFRAEWISAQGNPGQAKAGANISGLDVKKGESFASAAKRYMTQAEGLVTGGSSGSVQQSGFSNLWGG